MKVKIRKTNKLQAIQFDAIKADWRGRFVLTPSGFQPILAFDFIKYGATIRVNTGCGELTCDPFHRLLKWANDKHVPIFANELQLNDMLVGIDNSAVPVVSLSNGGDNYLYDVQIPYPHYWYTSGVVSHNSILLCNNAISSWAGINKYGEQGQNVLLVSFELDAYKTAARCLAVVTGVGVDHLSEHDQLISRKLQSLMRSNKKHIKIYDLAPEEHSVNSIAGLIDQIKRREGWKPDVVILDYMDLMISKNPNYNKDDYNRQKHVSAEIRGLAKNEDVLVFTATQTNRAGATTNSGNNSKGANNSSNVIGLDKAAESFGKQFALDYVISLNQSDEDRNSSPPILKMYIAKNRNGPKFEMISCEINYGTMIVRDPMDPHA